MKDNNKDKKDGRIKSNQSDDSTRSRRNVMKLAVGSGVSTIAFTGLASADTGSKEVDPNSSAKEFVEIGPDDDIGYTGNIEVTEGTSRQLGNPDETLSPSSHGSCRTIGDTWTVPVVGVDVGLEITFCPECDVSFEMTVLSQSTSYNVKVCGDEYRHCEGSTLNGGMFEISTEECYYYDETFDRVRVEITGEVCGVHPWHGWVCDSVDRTYYEPN